MKNKQLVISFVIGLLASAWLTTIAQAERLKIELLAAFDYPGNHIIETYTMGINEAGDIVGYTLDRNSAYRGFVRFADGSFSPPIIEPDDDSYTTATGITDSGHICGYYRDASLLYHGYVLSDGTFTRFDVPGATNTRLTGINEGGDLIGKYWLGSDEGPFLDIGGTVTEIMVHDVQDGIYPGGINNAGEFVGYYLDFSGLAPFGFFGNAATERVTNQVLAPRGTGTALHGLNDNGVVVGDCTFGSHAREVGLVYQRHGGTAFYGYPGAFRTEFTGINNNGLICGWYQDNIPHFHGIIAQLTTESERPATSSVH